jgi:tripartite-type tricarboxylate transporter receptor subunit TctC
MKLPRRRFLHLAAVAIGLPAVWRMASAQAYPAQPVRIIVGFAAGGAPDIAARLLAQWLSERLGQQFVIENRPGAGGNIATEAVVDAPADGYALLLVSLANAVNATLYEKLKYNFIRDIAPVASISHETYCMEVHPSFPAKTVPEFIAYAKANPGKITFASQGPGTSSHLTAELFMKLTGTKMLHVPYRGSGPALNDLVAGHVDFIFMEIASAYKLHEGGKARILAVATDHRIDVVPDVPTLIELGVPGFLSDTWNAISAPPKTPAAIVLKLNRTVNDVLNEATTKARFRELQLSAAGGTPQDMAKLKHDETERWTKVIREAGIEPE